MSFWYPNRMQWRVIWIAYAFIGFGLWDEIFSGAVGPTIFITAGAVLLVWWFAKDKPERGL